MTNRKTRYNPNCILTARETQIINLMAYEYSEKQIAKELFLSANTIHSHKKRVFQKLSVSNSAGVIRKAFELGILSVAV